MFEEQARPKQELETTRVEPQVQVETKEADGVQRTFEVTAPGDGNPRRLMLNLFREHYGFTDEDLAASDSLNLIPTDKVGGGNALTAEKILAKARINGGKFKLTVTADQDARLQRFKQDRSLAGAEDVRTVVEAFLPVELRSIIQPLLTAIVAGTREQRLQAARQLQALIYDGKIVTPAVAKQVREAVDGLQVRGRSSDAVLTAARVQLLMAENPVNQNLTDLLPTRRNPFDSKEDARSQPQQQFEAMRSRALQQIAALYKQIQERRTAGTLDRKEASTLYEMTAFLHEAYTGDREAAARDRAMARVYLSNQPERDQAEKEMADNKRTVISKRDPDEPTSMRASTKDERELAQLEQEKAYEEWAEINRQVQVPTFPQTDVFKSQRSEGQGETNNARVDAGRGGVTLIRTFVRWYVAHQRMMELAAKRERMAELKKKIARDNTIVVPPKPSELLALIDYFEKEAARIATSEPDRAAKLRAQASRIRNTLDLARAFWDQ